MTREKAIEKELRRCVELMKDYAPMMWGERIAEAEEALAKPKAGKLPWKMLAKGLRRRVVELEERAVDQHYDALERDERSGR